MVQLDFLGIFAGGGKSQNSYPNNETSPIRLLTVVMFYWRS
jgi:hypothetical protein